MKEKLLFFIKLIPIIYPIIIFLGYYHYFAYYRLFDIEIFHYLTISELLFSFMSLATPVFIAIFVTLCYFIFFLVLPNASNNEAEISEDEKLDESHLSSARRRLNKIQDKNETPLSLVFNRSHINLKRSFLLFLAKLENGKIPRAFSHLGNSLCSLIGLSIKVSLWIFFLVFLIASLGLLISPADNDLNYYKPFFTSISSTVWSFILWSCIAYAWIYRITKKNSNKLIGFSLRTIPIIFFVLFSLTVIQKIRYEQVISFKSNNIKFTYLDRLVQSDSTKIFIGKTAEFIFLRDIEKRANLVYPFKDVKGVEIIIR